MFIDLKNCDSSILKKAAEILYKTFIEKGIDHWKDLEEGYEEVRECLDGDFLCIGYLEAGELVGWAGLRPLYDKVTWELHPIVVKKETQNKGIGSKLLKELEKEVRNKGGLNIVLGTDDMSNRTSISSVDFTKNDVSDFMKNISNVNNHPYEFYQKNGYKIVGIIPDANGIGKPDIWMWKRIGSQDINK